MNLPPPEDSATKEELQALARRMRSVADATYDLFFRTGMGAECHAFLEFNGLLQKYVRICERAAEDGVDFRAANVHTGRPLSVEEHDLAYLAEKFVCIFGPIINASSKAKRIFLEALENASSDPRTPPVHFAPTLPFRALCGADVPNQSTTQIFAHVTCSACSYGYLTSPSVPSSSAR